MRSKIVMPLLVFAFFLTLINLYTFAASLTLSKIGAMDLGGKTYTEWWYTGVSPAFMGTALANQEVSVKIGDATYKALADSNGAWVYYSGLAAGDYDVTISQGSESYSFKLHLGSSLPSNLGGTSETTQSTVAVPVTGSNQLIALSLGLGFALLAGYFYISSDATKKLSFEKRMLND